MTPNTLIAAAASLQRLDGVAGVILFKGRNTVHKQMPFSDGRSLDLQETIGQMLDGYRQVRRKMRQIYLEFDGGTLLIVVQEESVLVLSGRGCAHIDGSEHTVAPSDVTWIPAGIPHCFRNISATEPLAIFWTYASIDATRTIVATGVTTRIDQEHVPADRQLPLAGGPA